MESSAIKTRLAENLAAVRQRMESAAIRAKRSPSSIRLLAVTKSVGPEVMTVLSECGITDIGENRVQDIVSKQNALGSRFTWHLIGNLQKNKARKAIQLCDTIHAVDSMPLFEELTRISNQMSKTTKLFIEVNVSGEGTKHGLKPGDATGILLRAKSSPRLAVVGLMTMAPLSANPEDSRPHFRKLRELRDSLNEMGAFEGPGLLSMGMSQDFEVAIEEGADWVRVGNALFEGIERLPEKEKAT